MTKVILDEATRAKLKGLTEHVELCDESGRTLGRALPEADYLRMVYDWANAQVSDEELERRSREPGGRTLAEIWERLGRK